MAGRPGFPTNRASTCDVFLPHLAPHLLKLIRISRMSITLPSLHTDTLAQLNSPAYVIFRDRLLQNLDSMIRVAKQPSRLRPHCKTHKMDRIIRLGGCRIWIR